MIFCEQKARSEIDDLFLDRLKSFKGSYLNRAIFLAHKGPHKKTNFCGGRALKLVILSFFIFKILNPSEHLLTGPFALNPPLPKVTLC